MLNGIINVHKEKGFTSHDVVGKLRGILKTRKIGHTGTLDPDATGVLPVCIGNATKLCDMFTEKTKEYRAVMLLGTTTDTEDISGTVLTRNEVNVCEADVLAAIEGFVGDYDQIPPMYSALKVNGKKLYEYAREGKEIERKPRKVTVFCIKDVSVALPGVTFTVSCSKGTYIRSLCRDIGEKLGCGACMESLVRTRSGNFYIENAIKLADIEKLAKTDRIGEILYPTESFFDEYPVYQATDTVAKLVKNGNAFREKYIGGHLRIHVEDEFIGVYYYDGDNEVYKPEKMFL